MHDKRKHPRVYAAATVSVFSAGRFVGMYLVQNLSEGGALLVGGPALAAGVEIGLVVRILGRCVVEVRATVLRHVATGDGLANVAVVFKHENAGFEEAIQAAVVKALAREGDPSVLVIHRSTVALVDLAEAVLASGRRTFLAVTALEAMRSLCHPQSHVDAVLIDATFDVDGGRAFLRFLREEFPHVRRILVQDAAGPDPRPCLDDRDADAALTAPWTASDVEAALRLHGSCEPSPGMVGSAS